MPLVVTEQGTIRIKGSRVKYMRILLLAVLPLVVFGQTLKTTETAFDIESFNKKFEIAQWLVAYDTVAWKTTDLVMAGDTAELARLKEKPTLGSIFFVWYYKDYFTRISIKNAKSTSWVIKNSDEYMWVHVENDSPSSGNSNAKP